MTREQQLELFQDLLLHTNGLYTWVYTPDMQLVQTTYPADAYQGFDTLFQIQIVPLLHPKNGPHHPQMFYSFFHLMWMVDYLADDDNVTQIYVIGPTFTGENSYNELVNEMDKRHLSIKTKVAVSKTLTALPIIPSNMMQNYGVQLHYLLSGQVLEPSDVQQFENIGNAESPSTAPVSNRHHGIWAAEQRFLQLFREGNPEYIHALSQSSRLSSGVRHSAKDSFRADKNNIFVLLTMVSRAAIEGGVSPDVSYDLCDHFAQRIEDAEDSTELGHATEEILSSYFQKVCAAKTATGISPIVKNCCDYIAVHISEKLSIAELAERAGYSEYYFSRKFKQEMGYSISEYIMREKIERAKVLLSTTNMSILDISLELSFNSRSYFSDSFQKIAGISPGEYRKQNVRL